MVASTAVASMAGVANGEERVGVVIGETDVGVTTADTGPVPPKIGTPRSQPQGATKANAFFASPAPAFVSTMREALN